MNPVQFLKRSAPRLLVATTLLAGAVLLQTTAGAVDVGGGYRLTVTADDSTHTVGSTNARFDVLLEVEDPQVQDQFDPAAGTEVTLRFQGVGDIIDVEAGTVTETLPIEAGDPQFICTTDAAGLCTLQVTSDEEGTSTLTAGFYFPVITPAQIDPDPDLEDADDIEWDGSYNDDNDVVGASTTPFTNTNNNTDNDPVQQVAGNNDPARPQPEQPQTPLVVAGETTSQPAPAAPAEDISPVALDTLPRTGTAARQMTMVGGLLLIAGGVASLIGRRRKANTA